jgi:hypothetical protein
VVGHGGSTDDIESGFYFGPEDNQHVVTWVLYKALKAYLEGLGAESEEQGLVTPEEYLDVVCGLLAGSEECDAIVLFAFAPVYDPETRELDVRCTDLSVSDRYLWEQIGRLNDHLHSTADPEKQFLLGASVSPNDPK